MASSSSKTDRGSSALAGKIVVLAIIAMALAASAIAAWHHWNRGKSTVQYWGTDAAMAIRYARQVTLRKLNRDGSGELVDISKARGLVHFRQALLEDASFTQILATDSDDSAWEVEVEFTSDDHQACVRFDLAHGLVGLKGKQTVLVGHPIQAGLKSFFADAGSD